MADRELEITTASAADMETLRAWADEERWNPGRGDALAFHAADPGGFLLGRLDGEPVASVSAVRYGDGFGFLGLYVARPEVRGQGYGIQMWRAATRRLAGRNVGLDGVVAQQANYRRSGFRDAWNHVRYAGEPPAAGDAPDGIALVDGRSVPFARLAAYDRRFFPAPRDAFLALWIGLPGHRSLAAVRDGELCGLAVLRPASECSRVGPLYAASADVARALLGGLAALAPGERLAVDVPDANPAAPRLMERLGLEPVFACARMYTGPVAPATIELG